MRVARYVGNGEIAIVEEERPACPPGGLVVQTEACGLCSGELMSWYMDRKVPHVLGHEVSGKVVESQDRRFPAGARVFPHHHAPCLHCEYCRAGKHVHCEQWKRTKLIPGGMADFFAVPAENLTDTWLVDDLRAIDAALIEPLACVWKSVQSANMRSEGEQACVIGLGTMGILHMLLLPERTAGYDINPDRVSWARMKGLNASLPDSGVKAETVFVCPGSQAAFDSAMQIVKPGGTLVMFAPLPPGEPLLIRQSAYFSDVRIVNSYSCGPTDTERALGTIRSGKLVAEQICSDFIGLEQLPGYYNKMKAGEILKPMVVWNQES